MGAANTIKQGWKQYPKKTVALWDDFISWEKRRKGEGNFFIDILKKNNVKSVLDIACGTGYDLVTLSKKGFKVKGCDGNNDMIRAAKQNTKGLGKAIPLVHCDWRSLVDKFKDEKFDAIICLGNSFTHLFSRKDRESVINQIYFLLKKDGVLIIDQRNYDYMLKHGYKSKHKYVYCGNSIDVDLVHTSKDLITLKYTKKGNGFFTLDLYPITIHEMKETLKKSGFDTITSYGDFQKRFSLSNTDFIQHVAIK